MGTGIEWTDETWNPTTGCTKVSSGCDHCYAERITNRFGGPGAFDTMVLHPDRLDKPLHWRKPRRVFVNSMSDLFHDDVPNAFIAAVFAVMADTPQHTYQILTKRHGRMRALVNSEEFGLAVASESRTDWSWPLENVWLGVSVEDQKRADLRIPALLATPAAVRFLSCEPLLGPIDLSRWMTDECTEPSHYYGCSPGDRGCSGLGWVIVGGESGPRARPMHPQWARTLRDHSVAAGVPFFFKQWGEWAPAGNRTVGGAVWIDDEGRSDGVWTFVPSDPPEYLEDIMVRDGRQRAGRVLDGRTWDEYPDSRGRS